MMRAQKITNAGRPGGAITEAPGAPVSIPRLRQWTGTELAGVFTGWADETTTPGWRAWLPKRASALFRVRGSRCVMALFGGDLTPYRVRVDDGAETTITASVQSSDKATATLFSGLSDDWHIVRIRSDNSATGQRTPITPAWLEVMGETPQLETLGPLWFLDDPASPIEHTFTLGSVEAGLSPSTRRPAALQTVWGFNNGSLHFRWSGQALWVFTSLRYLTGIFGGNWQVWDLGASPLITSTAAAEWKKLPIAAQATPVDIVINASPGETGGDGTSGITLQAVCAEQGTLAAPSVIKRKVWEFGASTVEQVAEIDQGKGFGRIYRLQQYLDIQAGSSGWAGHTVAEGVAAMPTWSAQLDDKHTIILNVGINSANDANFQPDYTALINAALAAGWQRVLCHGLITAGDQTLNQSKNAKIAAAVAAVNDPRVLYLAVAGADVQADWVATTDGAGGTITSPDGTHPNVAGYLTLAQLTARDHSARIMG